MEIPAPCGTAALSGRTRTLSFYWVSAQPRPPGQVWLTHSPPNTPTGGCLVFLPSPTLFPQPMPFWLESVTGRPRATGTLRFLIFFYWALRKENWCSCKSDSFCFLLRVELLHVTNSNHQSRSTLNLKQVDS